MSLNLDLRGIQLDFAVHDYKASAENDRFPKWYNVDFHIRSGNWLDYQLHGELLMHDEVDEILSRIDALLNSGVGESSVWECVEPDFRFTFHPQKDLTNDPRYTYVAPGHEIEDIKLEWSVYFWDSGLTENHLTLVLFREEIIALRNYLKSVTD